VSGCASKGPQSPTFPNRADLTVEPKPVLAPEALTSEAALDAHDIALETWGETGWAQVARLCRFFDAMGMKGLDCPPPPQMPPRPG
jgi:hypothetical protein